MSSLIPFASMALLCQLFTPVSSFAQDPWGYTYGTAVADTACAMIDDGVKKKRVNRVLDLLAIDSEEHIANLQVRVGGDAGEGADSWWVGLARTR